MMKKINKSLEKILRSYGIFEQAESAYICYVANEIAAGKFAAHSFKNGLLTLLVKDSYQAQEINFNQRTIIEAINNKIGKEKVQRIRFRIN